MNVQPAREVDVPEVKPVRRVLQTVGAIAAAYYVIIDGGFQHSVVASIVSAVAVLAVWAAVVLSWTRWRGWHHAALAAMTITGGLLVLWTGAAGWTLFAVGVVILIGRPGTDLRLAVGIVIAGAIPIAVDGLGGAAWVEPVGLRLLAVAGISVLGYTRRQRSIQRRQERELVERSQQLIEQTELTQLETARAAALAERNRIARDLHDVLAHSLGGLVVQLDAADAVLAAGGGPDQVAERLHVSRQLAVDGLHRARAAVRELREDGASVGQHDVAEAVQAVVRGQVGVQLGLEYEVVGRPRTVPAAVAQAFAAVAREALTNINKHAPGCRVVATLIIDPEDGRGSGAVRLEVINALRTDDHEPAELASTGGGVGVAGMRQRFAEIGGTLTATRQDDKWVVSARWPTMDREESDDDA